MTPEEFKAIRQRKGLSQGKTAKLLRIKSVRAIKYYEAGEREISGPISLCMDLINIMGPEKINSILKKAVK